MSSNNLIDAAIFAHIDEINKNNLESLSHTLYDDFQGLYSKEVIFSRVKKIYSYRKQLKKLQQLPFIKQRTNEWLELRKDRLTASDLYDAIKGGNGSMSLAKKKASVTTDNINYGAIPALKWGTMFEPMASRCYSQGNNNIQIHDFGLICDPNNAHFGASPDGINELGIMIEIKCPYTRKIIDGTIPVKYEMQIQGQLAVCKLEECDYIECEFKTFEDEEEYLENIPNHQNINHGVIAEYINDDRQFYYLYSDMYKSPLEAIENIQLQTQDHNTKEFIKFTYWMLININVQRVTFNKNDWKNIVPKIDEFWNKVEEYKLLPPEKAVHKKIQFIDDE